MILSHIAMLVVKVVVVEVVLLIGKLLFLRDLLTDGNALVDLLKKLIKFNQQLN